jgi:hypothetical protein
MGPYLRPPAGCRDITLDDPAASPVVSLYYGAMHAATPTNTPLDEVSISRASCRPGRVFNATAMGLSPGSAIAPQEPAKIS